MKTDSRSYAVFFISRAISHTQRRDRDRPDGIRTTQIFNNH